jgi:hypothetical protein
MASLTAGTTFVDGVANDVTAAKLGALVTNATPTSGLIQDRTAETVVAVNDTLLIGDASDSNNLKRMTVANLLKAPLVSTSGTVDVLTTGTTTSTAQIVTSGTIATLNSTTGTIATLNSTTGTIATLNSTTGTITNLSATTSTFLGAITGSTNVINIGSGQIYKDASGNVGIGTTSPAYKFVVSNAGAQGLEVQTTSSSLIDLHSYNRTTSSYTDTKVNCSSFIVAIGTSSATERLRITSGGVVRIGTTTELLSSANILETSGTNGIGVKATGGAGNSCMLAWNSATSGNNTFIGFYTEASPSLVGSIDFNRAATLTRYNTTSDATLKNIIGDSSGEESVSILKNTKIRDYTWKKDITNKVNVGVVAQELYEVFKGAVSVGGDIVSKDSEGNDITTYRPWGVDKTAFTFHLVAGWKAHEKLIQDLKAENDSLKSRLEALEAA